MGFEGRSVRSVWAEAIVAAAIPENKTIRMNFLRKAILLSHAMLYLAETIQERFEILNLKF